MWVLESEGEAFSGMSPRQLAFVQQLNVMQARNCGCGQGRNSSLDALVQKVRDLRNLLELS